MKQHNKQSKQGTVQEAVAVMEAPKAPLTPQTETEVIRGGDALARLFVVNGDKVSIAEGANPTAEEYALFIEQRISSAETSASQAAWALYAAKKAGEITYNGTIARLAFSGMSDSALANLKHAATVVIPFGIEQKYDAPYGLLKDAVAAIRDRSTGKTLTTPLAIALQQAFKSGKNPAGLHVADSKGIMQDVGEQPITLKSIRAIRALYDKDGTLKAPPVVDSPTPTLSTEQRSGTVANATNPENPTGATEKAPVPPVLVDEKKPDSAGTSPKTAGASVGTSGTMSEGEQIVAGFEAMTMRLEKYHKEHTVKVDERTAILLAVGKVAKLFGGQVVGV